MGSRSLRAHSVMVGVAALFVAAVGCGGSVAPSGRGEPLPGAPDDASAAADSPASPPNTVDAAAGGCTASGVIVDTNYDQSCSADSDCIAVGEGDVCAAPCSFVCAGTAAIARSAYARYQADLAQTGFDATGVDCACPAFTGPGPAPCCVAGRCQSSDRCPSTGVVDAGPPQGETGPAGAAVCTPLAAIGDDAQVFGDCHATRQVVSCTRPNGSACECITSGALACDGCGSALGFACQGECAPDEYALACGRLPTPPTDANGGTSEPPPPPPAFCRFISGNPGGISYVCCPCQ